MSFVVLFSTMSFSISEHFCGDQLVDTSYFFVADACDMMDMQMPVSSDECSIEQEDCCSDSNEFIQGSSEVQHIVTSLNMEQQVFLASFVYSYINLFEGLEKNVIPFKNYTPPIIVKDIQVLDNVFLI
ncbi:MAG: hypothetical protein JKY08_11885 [Flavobacteriaceae bacterium]|nr:hypothetical protein [Flavobacteriaceae bacterium]